MAVKKKVPTTARKTIITNRSDVQKLKNGIQEGFMILKAGKKSKPELEQILRSVNNSRLKIGLKKITMPTSKKPTKKPNVPKKVTKAKVVRAKKTYVKLVQTGSSNKRSDAKRIALKPGKRLSESNRTYYEYRANRTDINPRKKGDSL